MVAGMSGVDERLDFVYWRCHPNADLTDTVLPVVKIEVRYR